MKASRVCDDAGFLDMSRTGADVNQAQVRSCTGVRPLSCHLLLTRCSSWLFPHYLYFFDQIRCTSMISTRLHSFERIRALEAEVNRSDEGDFSLRSQ
jgi:hypothetical protein